MSISPQFCSVLLGIVMSGCGSQVPVSEWAVTSIVVDRDAGSLAACSYTKLEASQGTGIKKVGLQNSVVLALESGAVRMWELTFTPEANDRTQVQYSAVQRPLGPAHRYSGNYERGTLLQRRPGQSRWGGYTRRKGVSWLILGAIMEMVIRDQRRRCNVPE